MFSQAQVSRDQSEYNMFEELKAHQCKGGTAFHGTITEMFGDVERDGGKGSKLSALVPKLFRKQSMNVMDKVGSNCVVVNQFTENGEKSTLTFFYKTKILDARSSGGVVIEDIDTVTNPSSAEFVKEGCADFFCNTSLLKTKDGVYVVLSTRDQQLKCVEKDNLMEDGIYSLVTIFNTQQVVDDQPYTAIYFTVQGEDKKMYNYYLVPKDSQSTIEIKKVCVDKLTEEEKTDVNRKYLLFKQHHRNPGEGVKNGHQVKERTQEPLSGISGDTTSTIHDMSRPRVFRLGSDVEKD